ncbi:MAG: response regulator [Deltaproteobacteria bacterium]|nr:response regulator [Deltaproteobacteria bacterium]
MLNILIAEDDQVARKMLEFMVGKLWGYNFKSVTNGLKAVEEFKKGDYSLLLLDWMMPEMDGMAVIEEINNMTDHTTRPYIIMVTTRDESGDNIRALEHGADDFIQKPFDKGELLARIKVAERIHALRLKFIDEIRAYHELISNSVAIPKNSTVCMYCNKLRISADKWKTLDEYLLSFGGAASHGICPDCQSHHH